MLRILVKYFGFFYILLGTIMCYILYAIDDVDENLAILLSWDVIKLFFLGAIIWMIFFFLMVRAENR